MEIFYFANFNNFKMKSRTLTILIVNYNSSEFVELSLCALKELTKNPYEVFILDNGSRISDCRNLERTCSRYDNVFLERKKTNLKGSLAHGSALNYLVEKVRTPYFSVLDADATWLIKGWDEILISKINDKVKVIGTQAAGNKPKDFPLMYAILFETEAFRKLNIDFRPKDITKYRDTGYEIREKYLAAGFEGETIDIELTRVFQNGPFKDIICAEFYLVGYEHIFASHFGRGSTSGAHKYRKGCGISYKLPIIGRYLRVCRGRREKNKWIRICKDIVDKQL